jgi:hydroxymethylbilane synthase
VPIRGNVPTRVKKLAAQPEIDAIILAVAGLERLHFQFGPDGSLTGEGIPAGILGTKLSTEEMLPCVGQAAIGIEIRESDIRLQEICANLNDRDTLQCVLAERAFLKGMGGGCQLAVAAYAQVEGNELKLRAVSFLGQQPNGGEVRGPIDKPFELGLKLAQQLLR